MVGLKLIHVSKGAPDVIWLWKIQWYVWRMMRSQIISNLVDVLNLSKMADIL